MCEVTEIYSQEPFQGECEELAGLVTIQVIWFKRTIGNNPPTFHKMGFECPYGKENCSHSENCSVYRAAFFND